MPPENNPTKGSTRDATNARCQHGTQVRRRSFIGRFFRVLAAAFAFFMLTFAGLEVTLRIFLPEVLAIRSYPLVYQADHDIGYRYRPGSAGRLRIPGIDRRFVINEQGFLGPCVKAIRDPSSVRIAVIDSSDGTGIWMEGTEDYCRKLERMLIRNGQRAEVLNLCIDGQARDLWNIRIAYKDAARFDVQVVLLRVNFPLEQNRGIARSSYRGYLIHYNPAESGSRWLAEREVDQIEDKWIFKTAYSLSFCVRAASRQWMNHVPGSTSRLIETYIRKRQGGEVEAFRVAEVRAHELLLTLVQTLTRQGIEVFFFQYEEDATTSRAMEQLGLSDRNWVLSVPRDAETLNRHDAHFNETGHEIIAAQLHERLLPLMSDLRAQ